MSYLCRTCHPHVSTQTPPAFENCMLSGCSWQHWLSVLETAGVALKPSLINLQNTYTSLQNSKAESTEGRGDFSTPTVSPFHSKSNLTARGENLTCWGESWEVVSGDGPDGFGSGRTITHVGWGHPCSAHPTFTLLCSLQSKALSRKEGFNNAGQKSSLIMLLLF